MIHRRGFTLIEILIVVIILGILAAIVVPQFSNASASARRASVLTTADSVNKAIALYRVQHKDTPPDMSSWTALMSATDADGGTTGSPLYGPYLSGPPVNALTGNSVIGGPTDLMMDWVYDPTTNSFYGVDSARAQVTTP